MRRISQILVLLLAVITSADSARAQTPREQLAQMVVQLQATPGDNTLRERIIRLALEIKLAPAIPPEARRAFVMGSTYVTEAKSPEDFTLAVRAFQAASLLAPWWGDAYYNLSMALESGKRYDEAKSALALYLLTNPTDAEGAQNRLYALDAKQVLMAREAANSPEARAARQRAGDEALTASLNGAKFSSRLRVTDGVVMDHVVEIRGQEVHWYRVLVENRTSSTWDGLSRARERTTGLVYRLNGRRFDTGGNWQGADFGVITEDGSEVKFFIQPAGKEAMPFTFVNQPPYLRRQ
ncbi:MAG: hypothetical protein ACR2G6_07410 [Gemmatimonadaceae bacterium]